MFSRKESDTLSERGGGEREIEGGGGRKGDGERKWPLQTSRCGIFWREGGYESWARGVKL